MFHETRESCDAVEKNSQIKQRLSRISGGVLDRGAFSVKHRKFPSSIVRICGAVCCEGERSSCRLWPRCTGFLSFVHGADEHMFALERNFAGWTRPFRSLSVRLYE